MDTHSFHYCTNYMSLNELPFRLEQYVENSFEDILNS
jgi:hypothetical protein